ncbi:MAG TPA: SMI1/KNR4 family protein [Schlesneria sp.]
MIQLRFAEIEPPELKALADQLKSYKPVSIVVQESRCWIRLDSAHKSEIVGASAFVPVTPDAARIRSNLIANGFEVNSLFTSFMLQFAGLAEDFSSSGGFIREDEKWETLSEDWHQEVIDNYEDWRGSLMIYHARNGDQVLLHRDGQVGWWVFAEGHVERDFESFADFLASYISHRANVAWPLDSYGPRTSDPCCP